MLLHIIHMSEKCAELKYFNNVNIELKLIDSVIRRGGR